MAILAFLPGLAEHISALSDSLYLFANSISGRSHLLDSIIALPLENQLVKAAIIGSCFLAVWHGGRSEEAAHRNRRILLVTLVASVFVLAATKTLTEKVLLPRPFVLSQKIYHLEVDRLVENPRLAYHVPLDALNQKNYHALLRGELNRNDLSSFPSDHAGFYMTLALGIFLASRGLGLLAIGWTLVVTLGSRVITGQHSPLDVAVGAAIGVAILLLFQLLLNRWLPRLVDPVVTWTQRHQVLSAGVIFIVIFEAANTLQDLRPIFRIGKDLANHFIRG